jgi:hypothetical protein
MLKPYVGAVAWEYSDNSYSYYLFTKGEYGMHDGLIELRYEESDNFEYDDDDEEAWVPIRNKDVSGMSKVWARYVIQTEEAQELWNIIRSFRNKDDLIIIPHDDMLDFMTEVNKNAPDELLSTVRQDMGFTG